MVKTRAVFSLFFLSLLFTSVCTSCKPRHLSNLKAEEDSYWLNEQQLISFLLRHQPRYTDAVGFFHQAAENPQSVESQYYNQLVANSPTLSDAASQGFRLRDNYIALYKQHFMELADKALNPPKSIVESYENWTASKKNKTVPIRPEQAKNQALTKTKHRFELPSSYDESDIQINDQDAYDFYKRKLFSIEQQTTTKNQIQRGDFEEWKNFTINELNDLKGRNIQIALEIMSKYREIEFHDYFSGKTAFNIKELMAGNWKVIPDDKSKHKKKDTHNREGSSSVRLGVAKNRVDQVDRYLEIADVPWKRFYEHIETHLRDQYLEKNHKYNADFFIEYMSESSSNTAELNLGYQEFKDLQLPFSKSMQKESHLLSRFLKETIHRNILFEYLLSSVRQQKNEPKSAAKFRKRLRSDISHGLYTTLTGRILADENRNEKLTGIDLLGKFSHAKHWLIRDEVSKKHPKYNAPSAEKKEASRRPLLGMAAAIAHKVSAAPRAIRGAAAATYMTIKYATQAAILTTAVVTATSVIVIPVSAAIEYMSDGDTSKTQAGINRGIDWGEKSLKGLVQTKSGTDGQQPQSRQKPRNGKDERLGNKKILYTVDRKYSNEVIPEYFDLPLIEQIEEYESTPYQENFDGLPDFRISTDELHYQDGGVIPIPNADGHDIKNIAVYQDGLWLVNSEYTIMHIKDLNLFYLRLNVDKMKKINTGITFDITYTNAGSYRSTSPALQSLDLDAMLEVSRQLKSYKITDIAEKIDQTISLKQKSGASFSVSELASIVQASSVYTHRQPPSEWTFDWHVFTQYRKFANNKAGKVYGECDVCNQLTVDIINKYAEISGSKLKSEGIFGYVRKGDVVGSDTAHLHGKVVDYTPYPDSYSETTDFKTRPLLTFDATAYKDLSSDEWDKNKQEPAKPSQPKNERPINPWALPEKKKKFAWQENGTDGDKTNIPVNTTRNKTLNTDQTPSPIASTMLLQFKKVSELKAATLNNKYIKQLSQQQMIDVGLVELHQSIGYLEAYIKGQIPDQQFIDKLRLDPDLFYQDPQKAIQTFFEKKNQKIQKSIKFAQQRARQGKTDDLTILLANEFLTKPITSMASYLSGVSWHQIPSDERGSACDKLMLSFMKPNSSK